MMEREWSALLERYGQAVTVHRGEGACASRAFLQPVRSSGQEQQLPGPLGLRREDRFLYLGNAQLPLSPGDWLEWEGRGFEVQSTHPIYLGLEVFYIWAVLRPREEEAEQP